MPFSEAETVSIFIQHGGDMTSGMSIFKGFRR